jgi:hypothetical protein
VEEGVPGVKGDAAAVADQGEERVVGAGRPGERRDFFVAVVEKPVDVQRGSAELAGVEGDYSDPDQDQAVKIGASEQMILLRSLDLPTHFLGRPPGDREG